VALRRELSLAAARTVLLAAAMTVSAVGLGPPPLAADGAAALEVVPGSVVQGEAVRIPVHTVAAPTVLLVGDRAVPLHRVMGGYQAFVGTSPLTRPGVVRVEAFFRGQESATARARFLVRAGTFGVRRLQVPPGLLDPALAERERRRVAEATSRPLPAPLWRGVFLRPVAGPVTSTYGVRSVYNGVFRGHHLGVDLRAAAGTPVRAANDGVVTLAEALPLSGRTVILDHGVGIFTTYQHLAAVVVHPGQRVRRGHVLGQVGSTGLSTAPHLHWGMRIHGVRVDPLLWTTPGPLTEP